MSKSSPPHITNDDWHLNQHPKSLLRQGSQKWYLKMGSIIMIIESHLKCWFGENAERVKNSWSGRVLISDHHYDYHHLIWSSSSYLIIILIIIHHHIHSSFWFSSSYLIIILIIIIILSIIIISKHDFDYQHHIWSSLRISSSCSSQTLSSFSYLIIHIIMIIYDNFVELELA